VNGGFWPICSQLTYKNHNINDSEKAGTGDQDDSIQDQLDYCFDYVSHRLASPGSDVTS